MVSCSVCRCRVQSPFQDPKHPSEVESQLTLNQAHATERADSAGIPRQQRQAPPAEINRCRHCSALGRLPSFQQTRLRQPTVIFEQRPRNSGRHRTRNKLDSTATPCAACVPCPRLVCCYKRQLQPPVEPSMPWPAHSHHQRLTGQTSGGPGSAARLRALIHLCSDSIGRRQLQSPAL